MIDREQAIGDLLWRSGLGPLSREQATHFATAILALDDPQAERLQGLVARHRFERMPITDEMAEAMLQSFAEDAASEPPGTCPTLDEQLRRARKALDAAINGEFK